MSKRILTVLVLACTTIFAIHAFANPEAGKKAVSLKGELVDMGCYLGHGAVGAKHMECATKCVANGMPMGLLTADGKLYLLTLNHDNADPFNLCKTMMAKTVEVSGTVAAKGGIKSIDVTGVKAAAAN